ncbi:MAG: cyclase family protein [Ignavibacteria bacterium]|nr:cyclase family protein [Ignavibacteria bacterium]
MKATINHKDLLFTVDFSKPIDISLSMRTDESNVEAFYLPSPQFEPFRYGNTVLSKQQGGACNCEVLTIAPHGNGTHTECVGHISFEKITINQCLKEFIFIAELVTVQPVELNDDSIITKSSLESVLQFTTDALVIRTLPNNDEKESFHYSGTNPVYLETSAAAFIKDRGVQHLLLDVPSVDKEADSGELRAHHEYWNYPTAPRFGATITELVYIPNEIPDGLYLLNLQIASLETDASPSKPILYKIDLSL